MKESNLELLGPTPDARERTILTQLGGYIANQGGDEAMIAAAGWRAIMETRKNGDTAGDYHVGQLSWTIVTLCIVVGQMKFVAHNIFDGLFWFFFPRGSSSTTTAGRRWLVCPAAEITLVAHKTLSCETRAVFVKQAEYDVLGLFTLEGVAPIQLHAVCFALFASIVAPFGFRRPPSAAYRQGLRLIIPGHGGVTDRVDCEFIMALSSTCTTDVHPRVRRRLARSVVRPPSFAADRGVIGALRASSPD
ncbi:phosphatidate cytidylyltransferase [Aureococcus anophagefferens]|nr:phosphatidate cytidylyltransferase [Aureococcus anophagefferens]